jgi:hypothetical protein
MIVAKKKQNCAYPNRTGVMSHIYIFKTSVLQEGRGELPEKQLLYQHLPLYAVLNQLS